MTRVYGSSDDLIEVEGDVAGELCQERATLTFSDGTKLKVKYGKPEDNSVWYIRVLHVGRLFDRIDPCFDGEAKIYSDQAYFHDGITSVKSNGKELS